MSTEVHGGQPDDLNTGFDSVPARYVSEGGREVVDLMRDEAYFVAGAGASCGLWTIENDAEQRVIADYLFAYACDTHEMKYAARRGRKGTAEDAERDREKANWWGQMGFHALGLEADPRCNRENYVPYAYPVDPEASSASSPAPADASAHHIAVRAGQFWRHPKRGSTYEILVVTNRTADDPVKFPITAVYINTETRDVFSRPAVDFDGVRFHITRPRNAQD
jgi:hypothetical protein